MARCYVQIRKARECKSCKPTLFGERDNALMAPRAAIRCAAVYQNCHIWYCIEYGVQYLFFIRWKASVSLQNKVLLRDRLNDTSNSAYVRYSYKVNTQKTLGDRDASVCTVKKWPCSINFRTSCPEIAPRPSFSL